MVSCRSVATLKPRRKLPRWFPRSIADYNSYFRFTRHQSTMLLASVVKSVDAIRVRLLIHRGIASSFWRQRLSHST
jgi:hypothetical protein